jgi:hypothetical protein
MGAQEPKAARVGSISIDTRKEAVREGNGRLDS